MNLRSQYLSDQGLCEMRRAATKLFVLGLMFIVSFSIPQASQGQVQFLWDNNLNNGLNYYSLGFNWKGGNVPSSTNRAGFHLPGTYSVLWNATTAAAAPSVGSLEVLGGNVTFANDQVANPQQYNFTILGVGGPQTSDFSVEGPSTSLTISGLNVQASGGRVRNGATMIINGSHPVGSSFSVGEMSVAGSVSVAGTNANGTNAKFVSDSLSLTSGSTFSIGTGAHAAVGATTTFNSATELVVSDTSALSKGLGVTGGSTLTNSGNARIIGNTNPGLGALAFVSGSNSKWINGGDLQISLTAGSALSIANNGLVSVGGATTIGSAGTVTLDGGRFEFGTTTLPDLSRINGVSGSLAGGVNHNGYTNVSSITSLQISSVDVSDVKLVNSGTLYGNAALGSSLVNASTGRAETLAGERMRFAGAGNTNAGQVNVYGGQVAFAQDLTNQANGEINNFGNSFVANHVTNDAGGLIAGRGQFVINAGLDNSGVIAFTNGVTDVIGDVNNLAGGQIVTSGNGATTFYGDVDHNGAEIRTTAGSSTVFLGAVSGAGNFTGAGTVFMDGDLRPGNSPAQVSFEGDLVLGPSATSLFELGGLNPGDFDQLLVYGNLALGNSTLDVSLLGSFDLQSGMQFLIADVRGSLLGAFNGLSQGDTVGTFGGTDLFITYNGFGGNRGVGLFTLASVPEPGSVTILSLGVVCVFSRRRKKRFAANFKRFDSLSRNL